MAPPVQIGGICFVSPGTIGTHKDQRGPYYWLQESLEVTMQRGQNIFFAAENDSNIAALGELWYGTGSKEDSFVLYNIGHGIGAAVCSHGKVLSSTHGINTEIGHITIKQHKKRCSCGNYDCLELYANISVLEKKFCNAFKEEALDSCNLNIKSLIQKAEQGNLQAIQILNDYNSVIAEGGLILANMFGPDRIIIAPNEIDTLSTPTLPKKIQSVIQKRSFLYKKKNLTVEYSSLGNHIHYKGGIALLAHSLFLENH